ncbi:MAG TPA: hypothetical protein VHM88_20855 [Candidatus Acidoferrales bacterium]|nr:hypothetical protein [Candidatus Acidoferrales bacterium]
MALPETIPVRYTEEEAEYLSVRPVVRQTFRLQELLDMVLSVTGKDPARVRQILRSGTVVFHFYRYWWQGFEADAEELSALLALFPDADPTRPFRREDCTAVLLESGGQPPRHSFELDRKRGSRRLLFRTRSFWDWLLDLTRSQTPAYQGYSYLRRADAYQLALSSEQAAALERDAVRLAPRPLRAALRHLPETSRIIFLCPRQTA